MDRGLVVWFPSGSSFTGEDSVELHCHGSSAITAAVVSAIVSDPHCRLAAPGEFTLRAFQNGCMDFAEVEALSDLIAAETEVQRKQAMRLMDGALHTRVGGWREHLLRAQALVEATIDWADEEVPEDVSPEVISLLDSLIADMGRELKISSPALRLRDGFEVAIIGAPNSGKSSFINYLAGREAAITSPDSGYNKGRDRAAIRSRWVARDFS